MQCVEYGTQHAVAWTNSARRRRLHDKGLLFPSCPRGISHQPDFMLVYVHPFPVHPRTKPRTLQSIHQSCHEQEDVAEEI